MNYEAIEDSLDEIIAGLSPMHRDSLAVLYRQFNEDIRKGCWEHKPGLYVFEDLRHNNDARGVGIDELERSHLVYKSSLGNVVAHALTGVGYVACARMERRKAL